MRGQGHSFLFKDWNDFKSCHGDQKETDVARTDQTLGTATAGQTQFQLKKVYTVGATATYTRLVYKPKTGTVLVDKDGSNDTAQWTVGSLGVITRSPALSGGEVIKAGFEYYKPVRFAIDKWDGSFRAWSVGSVDVRVMEIRLS